MALTAAQLRTNIRHAQEALNEWILREGARQRASGNAFILNTFQELPLGGALGVIHRTDIGRVDPARYHVFTVDGVLGRDTATVAAYYLQAVEDFAGADAILKDAANNELTDRGLRALLSAFYTQEEARSITDSDTNSIVGRYVFGSGVTSQGTPGPGPTPQPPVPTPIPPAPLQEPAPPEGLSTGSKVAIAVVGIAALAGIVYLATRKPTRRRSSKPKARSGRPVRAVIQVR